MANLKKSIAIQILFQDYFLSKYKASLLLLKMTLDYNNLAILVDTIIASTFTLTLYLVAVIINNISRDQATIRNGY